MIEIFLVHTKRFDRKKLNDQPRNLTFCLNEFILFSRRLMPSLPIKGVGGSSLQIGFPDAGKWKLQLQKVLRKLVKWFCSRQ